MGQQFAGHNPGCEQPMNGEHGRSVGPPPPPPTPVSHPIGLPPHQSPWQAHFARFPPNRPPPMPREGEQHHVSYHGTPPHPINLPPPQLRLVQGADDSRSPSHQSGLPEHPVSANLEYNHIPPYTSMKPPAPPPTALPLVQSICNPPPPPPSPPTYTQSRQLHHHPRGHPPMQRYHHHHHQHQIPVAQNLQAPAATAPPWMN